MIPAVFLRKPTYRRFEYQPRYYNPLKDDEERRKRRIRFERHVRRGRHKPLLWAAAMFALVFAMYLLLAR